MLLEMANKIKGMGPYQLGYINWNMAVVIHSKYRLSGVMVSVLTCRVVDRRSDHPSDQTGLLNWYLLFLNRAHNMWIMCPNGATHDVVDCYFSNLVYDRPHLVLAMIIHS